MLRVLSLLVLLIASAAHAAAPTGDCCLHKGGELNDDVSLKCRDNECPPTATASITNTPTRTATITPTGVNTATSTATPTATSTATNTATATASPTGQALANWCNSMVACWEFEEATGATRVSGGTCGTDCNLPDVGATDVAQNTTDEVSGLAAADGDGTSAYLKCTYGAGTGCEDLNLGSDSFSFGGFVYGQSDANLFRWITKAGAADEIHYGFARNNTGDVPFCVFRDTGNTDSFPQIGGSAFTLNTWHHYVCEFDDAGNTASIYWNHAASQSLGFSNDVDQNSTGEVLSLANAAETVFNDALIDEQWVAACVLSATDRCRLCSCGAEGTVNGVSLCACDPGTPANYLSTGRNASCGSCTLPACNKASPDNCNTPVPTSTATATAGATATPTPIAENFDAACSSGDCATMSRTDDVYPPVTGAITFSNFLNIDRSLLGSDFSLETAGICFDTSGLGDTVTVTNTCTLRIETSTEGILDDDNRSVTAAWRASDLAWSNADWTDTAGTDAHAGTDISTLTSNTVTDFALTGCTANVDKTGRTCVQLWVSGGEPADRNLVNFSTSSPSPQLRITYQP